MLPLAEKKALIRQLLIEIGTDVNKNDGDPTGDGDQTTIPTVEKRDVARHLFAAGGDISEHFAGGGVSKFAMACASGSLKTVQSELLSVKSTAVQPFSNSGELRKLLETRETSMRLSPLLLIVSLGKVLFMPGSHQQFEAVAKLLLKTGASPVAKDVVGKTVAHYGAGGMATKMTLEVCDMCIRAAKSHHLFGKDVKLQGLKTEEMNGKLGIVGGFDADSNRRAVYLTEDEREVWIKVENIVLQDQDSKPYPLLTDIQDRLGNVSLQEIIMPSEAPGTIVDETAEFLLKKHNTSIYTEDCDGCSPIQMVSGMGIVNGERTVSKLVMEAATKKGRETRKARKQEGSTCANCNKTDDSNGEKLLVCSRCKVVRYCGRDCQVQHWKEHKKECKSMSSLSASVTLGPPGEFSLPDGMSSFVQNFRGGGNSGLRQDSGYKKPRGKKYDEKFVIKCQGNGDSSPLLIYDQTRTCQFYLRKEQKGFKEISLAIRNEPAWQGRKTFMKASFDKSGVCTVYPEKAGVKSHYTW